MRTKTKTESKNEPKSATTNTTEKLTCPICGKEFEPNDDTKYIIAGGYTCSWKCFSDEVKRREAKKKQEEKNKYKENKNRKNKYRYIPYVVVEIYFKHNIWYISVLKIEILFD